MTPLAQLFLKQLTLPVAKRTAVKDPDDITHMMNDIHCFEVSDVYDAAFNLARDLHTEHYVNNRFPPKLAFLPAPKTWIELQVGGKRDAFFLIEGKNRMEAKLYTAHGYGGRAVGAQSGFIDLECSDPRDGVFCDRPEDDEYLNASLKMKYMIYAFLALINTPRVIGRRQHMPHRGLERKLLAAQSVVGKFPLQAWTEIKLEVSPEPSNESGAPSTEAHLTGERALHFCRAHLRVRLGRLEVVRGHWRGDASLGIRRSRYRLQSGKTAA